MADKQATLTELLDQFEADAPELAKASRSVTRGVVVPVKLPPGMKAAVSTSTETKQSGLAFLGSGSR